MPQRTLYGVLLNVLLCVGLLGGVTVVGFLPG